MKFLELMEGRRSCRAFLEKSVEEDVLQKILHTTLSAPSSKNCRSTRLAVVRDRALLEKISEMRDFGSAFLKDVPMAVIVMADESATDLWVDNCAISAIYMQLAAESLGLASCWVHVKGRPRLKDVPGGDKAEDYLHSLIPETRPFRIECIVALGYPAQPARPHKEQDDSDKIFYVK